MSDSTNKPTTKPAAAKPTQLEHEYAILATDIAAAFKEPDKDGKPIPARDFTKNRKKIFTLTNEAITKLQEKGLGYLSHTFNSGTEANFAPARGARATITISLPSGAGVRIGEEGPVLPNANLSAPALIPPMGERPKPGKNNDSIYIDDLKVKLMLNPLRPADVVIGNGVWIGYEPSKKDDKDDTTLTVSRKGDKIVLHYYYFSTVIAASKLKSLQIGDRGHRINLENLKEDQSYKFNVLDAIQTQTLPEKIRIETPEQTKPAPAKKLSEFNLPDAGIKLADSSAGVTTPHTPRTNNSHEIG